jgi:hypothetical protein
MTRMGCRRAVVPFVLVGLATIAAAEEATRPPAAEFIAVKSYSAEEDLRILALFDG